MHPVLDAFWRAAAYSLHPKVLLLWILPLVVLGAHFSALRFAHDVLAELERLRQVATLAFGTAAERVAAPLQIT